MLDRADAGQITVILATMRPVEQSVAINNKLCVQFLPANANDQQFTMIKNGNVCISSVSQQTEVDNDMLFHQCSILTFLQGWDELVQSQRT